MISDLCPGVPTSGGVPPYISSSILTLVLLICLKCERSDSATLLRSLVTRFRVAVSLIVTESARPGDAGDVGERWGSDVPETLLA
jgi:hypothetical protein